MRHQHQPAGVLVNCRSERVNRLDVQVIRRLVEQQQVGLREADHGEDQARLLAIRQEPYGRGLEPAGDAVLTEVTPPLVHRLLHVVVLLKEKFDGMRRRVEDVHAVLVVPSDGQVPVPAHAAGRWNQVAGHELEQSRFSRAVGSHERDAGVAIDTKLQPTQQVPTADVGSGVGKRHLLEGEHRRRELATLRERQLERLLRLGRRREPGGFHLVEDLLLGVGLLHHVGVCSAGCDKLAKVLDIRLLLVVLLLLYDVFSLQCLLVGVVVTRVVLELAVREADDVCAHPVEEIL